MSIPGNITQSHAAHAGAVEARPNSSPTTTARQAVPHVHAAQAAPAAVRGRAQARAVAGRTARFLLHFGEMLLAMELGMALFHLLLAVAPGAGAGALGRGGDLHQAGMAVFMTVPMVGWMRVRGHGWRHIAEMAAAMLVPMAAVIVLCRLGADTYLPWLAGIAMPAMYVGMLADMLYRRDLYTGHAGHHAHSA